MGVDFIGNLMQLQPGEFFTVSPDDRSVGGRYQEMMDILGQGEGQMSGSGVTRVGLWNLKHKFLQKCMCMGFVANIS